MQGAMIAFPHGSMDEIQMSAIQYQVESDIKLLLRQKRSAKFNNAKGGASHSLSQGGALRGTFQWMEDSPCQRN